MAYVLICEDDALLAADLASCVESAGHVVHGIFANASDAANATQGRLPDIAIIDLQLADGHTGSALAQSLQSQGVRIIVLSGFPNTGNELGVVPHTYAAKPISSELIFFLLNPGSKPSPASSSDPQPFPV